MKLSIGLIAAAICCVSKANAQPADNGRILQDETGRYPDAEATILQARTEIGIPFKVYVGLRTPNNTNVFSHNLARQWNIPADGLLFCIFDDRRQVAITAGTDLESRGINGGFISQTLIPNYFKTGWQEGSLAGAVRSSVVAIRDRLKQSPPVNRRDPANLTAADQPDNSAEIGVEIALFAVLAIGAAIVLALLFKTARRVRAYPGYGTSAGLDESGVILGQTVIMTDVSAMSDPGLSFDSSPSMDMGGGFDSGGGFSDTGSGDF